MKKHFILIGVLFINIAASSQDSLQKSQINLSSIEELKLMSVLWQQDAAEYRALCYQAFNTATMRLNEISKKKFKKEHIAIITDLDETILDNSYLEAQLIKDGKTYSYDSWKNWTDLSMATPVPGAVEFLQYAKQKGASIFYVSNRSVNEVPSTFINLKKLHLPDADTTHMLFMYEESSKELRRRTIMNNYNVVMLLGDNLNDFMQVFERKNIADRLAETDNVKEEWGNKFIVLPNPTYGEWEAAFYNYDYNLSAKLKLNMLLSLLKGINISQ